jgi:hypothetical protein
MAEAAPETTYLENPFGVVTDRRVVYYRKKDWFSGGSREDVPLKHVTSIRFEISRSMLGGILLILLGLALLMWVVGVVPLALGVLLVWGSPRVIVTTAAGDREAMKGWPWDREPAEAFAKAVRDQLFKEKHV